MSALLSSGVRSSVSSRMWRSYLMPDGKGANGWSIRYCWFSSSSAWCFQKTARAMAQQLMSFGITVTEWSFLCHKNSRSRPPLSQRRGKSWMKRSSTYWTNGSLMPVMRMIRDNIAGSATDYLRLMAANSTFHENYSSPVTRFPPTTHTIHKGY